MSSASSGHMGSRNPGRHVGWLASSVALFAFGCAEGAPPGVWTATGTPPPVMEDPATAMLTDAGAAVDSGLSTTTASSMITTTDGAAPIVPDATAPPADATTPPPAMPPPTTPPPAACAPPPSLVATCETACAQVRTCNARLPVLFDCANGCTDGFDAYLRWPACL